MSERFSPATFVLPAAVDAFPPPDSATDDGLLAVGGDLSEARLIYAYRNGIFPWYNDGEPILWWSPDPRCVLFPCEFKVPRSVAKSVRRQGFSFTFDTAFESVIEECAAPRVYDDTIVGTWITDEMQRAYINLHRRGVAHSVEVWQDGDLVGGLYGLAIGGVFSGESMFHTRDDASKAAMVFLIEHLLRWDFELVDCQLPSAHLLRLGAREIPRGEFIRRLLAARDLPGRDGLWL